MKVKFGNEVVEVEDVRRRFDQMWVGKLMQPLILGTSQYNAGEDINFKTDQILTSEEGEEAESSEDTISLKLSQIIDLIRAVKKEKITEGNKMKVKIGNKAVKVDKIARKMGNTWHGKLAEPIMIGTTQYNTGDEIEFEADQMTEGYKLRLENLKEASKFSKGDKVVFTTTISKGMKNGKPVDPINKGTKGVVVDPGTGGMVSVKLANGEVNNNIVPDYIKKESYKEDVWSKKQVDSAFNFLLANKFGSYNELTKLANEATDELISAAKMRGWKESFRERLNKLKEKKLSDIKFTAFDDNVKRLKQAIKAGDKMAAEARANTVKNDIGGIISMIGYSEKLKLKE